MRRAFAVPVAARRSPLAVAWLLAVAIPGTAQRIPDQRLNSVPPGTAQAHGVRIAASGANVYVVWRDSRHASSGGDIYFNASTDGGSTWMPNDLRIGSTKPGSAAAILPDIAAVGPNVYVTWSDDREGVTGDIYFNASRDGGRTWMPADVQLNTSRPAVGPLAGGSVAAGCRRRPQGRRENRPVVPWLLGILVVQARHQRRERRLPEGAALLARPTPRDPADIAAEHELLGVVQRVQCSLREPYRGVLELHLERGFSSTEIAAALQRPASAREETPEEGRSRR